MKFMSELYSSTLSRRAEMTCLTHVTMDIKVKNDNKENDDKINDKSILTAAGSYFLCLSMIFKVIGLKRLRGTFDGSSNPKKEMKSK